MGEDPGVQSAGPGPLVDTHAHLDAASFDDDLDAVIERARDAGVERILTVGSDLPSSLKAIEIANTYPIVYAAVGVHPHEAVQFRAQAEPVRALLGEDKVVAVGEIGLDYYRCPDSSHEQMEAFGAQLDWARELGKPVSVHNRSADKDVLEAVSDLGVPVILHCFSGSVPFATRAINAGCHLSFAGNLTFPKSHALRQVARLVPLEQVLIETDAPVLAPREWRGRRNEPAHVRAVADVLAAAFDIPLPALLRAASDNANRLFGWRSP